MSVADKAATGAAMTQSGAARRAAQAGSLWERPAVYRYGFLAFIIVLWELTGPFINPIFFSYPSKIAVAFWNLTLSGELPYYLGQSLEVMGYGLLAAIVVGIPLAVAMARIRKLDWALELPINALYATPMVALVPLLVLWFGIHLKAKIIVVFLFAVFPILINTYQGVRECDKGLLEVAKSFRATEWRIWQDVLLPFRHSLYRRRHPPRHRPWPCRHGHRRVLYDHLRPGLHDHALCQCLRDGQDVRAGDRSDDPGCRADKSPETVRAQARTVEPRAPLTHARR